MTKATTNIVERCEDVPQRFSFLRCRISHCPSPPILMRWPWNRRSGGATTARPDCQRVPDRSPRMPLRRSRRAPTATSGSPRVGGRQDRQDQPRRHAITEFTVPTANSDPGGITAGPDGNLWFTESARQQDRPDQPAGYAITEFPSPRPAASRSRSRRARTATSGSPSSARQDRPASTPPAQPFTEFTAAPAGSDPAGITTGPDGNLWFTEVDCQQDRRITHRRLPSPSSPCPRRQRPEGSRRARTATSGSPSSAPARSAISRPPAPCSPRSRCRLGANRGSLRPHPTASCTSPSSAPARSLKSPRQAPERAGHRRCRDQRREGSPSDPTATSTSPT